MVVNWKQMFTAALGPFHLGEEKFYKLCTATPCFRCPPPSPTPSQNHSTVCLCESILDSSIAVESGSIRPSVTGLLHSSKRPAGSSVSSGSDGSPALSLLKAVQVKYAENLGSGHLGPEKPTERFQASPLGLSIHQPFASLSFPSMALEDRAVAGWVCVCVRGRGAELQEI